MVRRVPGTLLRVHGFAVHSGFPTSSHGHAVAVNVCPLSWLEVQLLLPCALSPLRDHDLKDRGKDYGWDVLARVSYHKCSSSSCK